MSIGDALRAAREEKGLSIPEVSARIRISKRYIQALEDGNFLMIPSLVYAKGFVKAYAEFLGLDAKSMVSQLVERYPVKKAQPRPAETRKKEPFKMPQLPAMPQVNVNATYAVYIVLVLIFLVLVGYEISSGRKQGETPAEFAVTPEAEAVKAVVPPPQPPKKPAAPAEAPADKRPGVKVEAIDDVRVEVSSDGQVVYQGQLAKAHWVVFRGRDIKVSAEDGGSVRVYLNGHNMGMLGATGERAESEYHPYQ